MQLVGWVVSLHRTSPTHIAMLQSGCFPKDLAEEVMNLYENAKLKVNLRKFLGNLLGENVKEWMSSDCEHEGNKEDIPSPKRKKSDHEWHESVWDKTWQPKINSQGF